MRSNIEQLWWLWWCRRSGGGVGGGGGAGVVVVEESELLGMVQEATTDICWAANYQGHVTVIPVQTMSPSLIYIFSSLPFLTYPVIAPFGSRAYSFYSFLSFFLFLHFVLHFLVTPTIHLTISHQEWTRSNSTDNDTGETRPHTRIHAKTETKT